MISLKKTKSIKEFIIFHRITLRPLTIGAMLALFLAPLYQLHVSFCSALNSLFSPNLMLFSAALAAAFHSLSIFSDKLSIASELFYEAATQLTCILLSGIAVTLIVLNLVEGAMLWKDLALPATSMTIYLALTLSTITTIPYFILRKHPISENKILKKLSKTGFIFPSVIFIALAIFYFSTPEGLPEHNFCATNPSEVQ